MQLEDGWGGEWHGPTRGGVVDGDLLEFQQRKEAKFEKDRMCEGIDLRRNGVIYGYNWGVKVDETFKEIKEDNRYSKFQFKEMVWWV